MASVIDYCTEGPRIFVTGWKRRLFPKRYEGNAEKICTQIVEDCWNGRYFQTSTGNFAEFWTRDFGMCVKSLLALEYEPEVHKTLRYALNRFRKYGRITTTITPSGKPYDFPTVAVDSVPWLIHSIKISRFPYHSYKAFLNKEILKFAEKFINQQTGLVTPDEHFSSVKDFAIRKSSCYDNCLAGLLAKDLKSMKLVNPFKRFDYPDLLTRHFWNGSFFYDDLSKKCYVAGDANVFPFLLGLVKDTNDKEMMTSAVKSIQKAGLDSPFPLKYTASRKDIRFIWQEIFLRNYESNALWMNLGPLYVKLVKSIDREKAWEYQEQYTQLIEKHGNFLEVFTLAGKPYRTPFYYCDSGMVWAANYVTL